jgi:hypothetical protein
VSPQTRRPRVGVARRRAGHRLPRPQALPRCLRAQRHLRRRLHHALRPHLVRCRAQGGDWRFAPLLPHCSSRFHLHRGYSPRLSGSTTGSVGGRRNCSGVWRGRRDGGGAGCGGGGATSGEAAVPRGRRRREAESQPWVQRAGMRRGGGKKNRRLWQKQFFLTLFLPPAQSCKATSPSGPSKEDL